MNTSDRLFSKLPETSRKKSKQHNFWGFFHRLNIRFPWLKFIGLTVAGLILLARIFGLSISKIGDPAIRPMIAPMLRHVKATERPERVLEGKMLVALTFDDGPSPSTTPGLIDILYEKNAPSTFFVLGNMARANPDIVRRAERKGNEIASHTLAHQNLIRISAAAARADIAEATAIYGDILGHPPAFTRPPYGNTNDVVRASAGTPIILWSVDTLDWQSKNPAAILENAKSQAHDGAIILMHDIYPTSVEAVPAVIDALREAGYEFVTISELAAIRGTALTPGTVYYNFRP